MIRRLALAALLALLPGLASAQMALISPTAPNGDSSDRIANTAFVQQATGGSVALQSGRIFIGSAGNVAVGQPVSGDCTLSIAGALVCLDTNGVPFGALATVTPGTGVASALANPLNGTAGLVTFSGAFGTPTSMTLTNGVGLPLTTGITGTLGYANGGCSATSQTACRNNIFPTPTRAGDVAIWNGTLWTTLTGNNSGTQFFQENASGVPSWATVSGSGTITSVTCFGTAITSSGTCTTAAAKTDQQAGNSTTLVVTPSQQQSHDSAAKAWVNFAGSGTNGAQTVNASYNVSGVSRTGAGLYTISFTTSFASSFYACSVTINSNSSSNLWGETTSLAVGTANVAFLSSTSTVADPSSGMVICFGRQ